VKLADLFSKSQDTSVAPLRTSDTAPQDASQELSSLRWARDIPPLESPLTPSAIPVADLLGDLPFTPDFAEVNRDVLDDSRITALGEGLDDPYILRAVFVVGAGGSGKSTIADEMFGGRGLKRIDQDQHLARITLEKGKTLADVGSSYGDFKAAQKLARKERDQYAERRLGLVIDATGWEYQRVAEPMKRLRDEFGYDCTMVFVTTSLDTALDRNAARAASGGRKVPGWSIEKAHEGVHANLLAYRKLFGKNNLVVIKNDKDIPQDEWAASIAPELYRIGSKLLDRPIKNPIGRKWIKSQIRGYKLETAERPTIVLPVGLFDSDLPRDSLSLEEAPESKATLDRPFSKTNDDGDAYIMLDGEQIGQIQYFYNPSTRYVDISYVGVRAEFRRGGHAQAALRQFVAQVRRARAKGITAEAVWQGSLDMLMRVLGKPDYLGDDVKQYGVGHARKVLPNHQVADPDGNITGGGKVFLRWDW
jgi:predicted ABC-type ATPase